MLQWLACKPRREGFTFYLGGQLPEVLLILFGPSTLLNDCEIGLKCLMGMVLLGKKKYLYFLYWFRIYCDLMAELTTFHEYSPKSL